MTTLVSVTVPAPVTRRGFQVWLQGASARQNGAQRASCPHQAGGEDAKLWLAGWDAWARDETAARRDVFSPPGQRRG